MGPILALLVIPRARDFIRNYAAFLPCFLVGKGALWFTRKWCLSTPVRANGIASKVVGLTGLTRTLGITNPVLCALGVGSCRDRRPQELQSRKSPLLFSIAYIRSAKLSVIP